MPVEIEKQFPKRADVLRVVREEQRKALTETGRFIRAKAAKYPEKGSSASYKRTGTLGRSIAVSEPRAGEGGTFVEVGTNLHYAKYVEYGTGIYGPKGQPITPKTAKALAWRSVGGGAKMIAFGLAMRKGKAVRAQKRDVYMNFAKSVKGMKPWHFMEKAFTDPESEAYFKQRIEAMITRINQRTGGAT
jgi:HK97 gp10 family phage protein